MDELSLERNGAEIRIRKGVSPSVAWQDLRWYEGIIKVSHESASAHLAELVEEIYRSLDARKKQRKPSEGPQDEL